MQSTIDPLKERYKKNKETYIQEFLEFLHFASISSEKEFKSDLNNCKDWLSNQLKQAGLEVEEWQTTGHPTLFAHHCHAGKEKPTVLIYCHYDVQPVDPIELWNSPPFEPEIRDGEIYARGSSDDKGQCFYVVKALQDMLLEKGSLPVNVKLLIEGEEEIGSTGLAAIIPERKASLQADYLVVVDLSIPSLEQPAVTLGTRGIVAMTVNLRGSSEDLHSGQLGGIVYNPLHALVEILASLRNSDGSIAIEGFYDGVTELPETEKSLLSFDFDPEEFKQMFGAKASGGETSYPPAERASLRPTLEINGIKGGYGGDGFKTVIPAEAIAKISCRLVAGQDPERIGQLVKKAIEAKAPEGIDVSVTLMAGSGKAANTKPSCVAAKAFAEAYEKVFQHPCQFLVQGGSIPITAELAAAAEAESVMIGVGLPDDGIHAPNEHFGVDRIEMGYLLICNGLSLLGK